MKKIMFYFEGIYNGGTEIAACNLLSKLSSQDFKIYLAYSDLINSDQVMVNRLLEYSEIHNINEKIDVDVIVYATDALKDFDIIQKNISYKKSYFWFHYFWETQERFIYKIITENKIDKIIVVSEMCKRKIAEMDCMRGNEDKIVVIHNILDIEKIRNKANEETPILNKSTNLNIVTIARFAPIKGYERVVKLVELLKKNRIDFKWFIIGKANEYEKEYGEKIYNLLGKYKEVEFLGHQDNPFKFLKQCDYTAVLSERETWSLVISESKILGIPCIATNFESVYEQIEHLKNGIIIDKDDDSKYLENVHQIIQNKEVLKNNLKDFVYNNEDIINKWKELLEYAKS